MTKRIKVWLGVLAVLILGNVVFFSPLYFRHLLPFPGDLLVSFFFPWSGGGFPGYNSWTTHKEYLAADAIRQILPWKDLAFNLLKQGQWPLWNPFNFSGNVLMANLQSSIFFPGSWFFFILPAIWAYVGNVVLIMTLFGLFTVIFLRSLKLSWPSCVFGGIAATSISYLVGWQEILVNIQTALFLPLILWAVNKNKFWLVSFLLALAVFGGHIQTAMYVFFIVFAYMLFVKVKLKIVFLCLTGSLLISAVQVVPALEAYLASARENSENTALVVSRTFPWGNLVTTFASDFLGNKATNNFQSFDYVDARSYFGITAMVLAFLGLLQFRKYKEVRFFTLLGLSGIIFATWPVALIFAYTHIPVLSSSVPSRMILVFEFSAVIVAAYGFENFSKNSKALLILFGVYAVLWATVLLKILSFSAVAGNNLIIPSLTFLATVVTILISKRFPKLVFCLILLAILEPGYYFIKYQPFSKPEFAFPAHPILTYLHQNAGINRFFGFGNAYLDNNFATEYRIYSAEGYDPLFVKHYGELINSSQNGKIPPSIPRSDVKFGSDDNLYCNRLLDLLGVKYMLDKNDNPQSSWEPDNSRFPPNRYTLVWQYWKWKVYERQTALPRYFLVGETEIISDPTKIITRLYDPTFPLGQRIILEQAPNWPTDPQASASAKLVSYEPNKVIFDVQSSGNKYLFLSDTYYPGWKGSVDSQEAAILRADYALRAIPVPAGHHTVIFYYDPLSFKIGAALTVLGLLFVLLWLKKSFRT